MFTNQPQLSEDEVLMQRLSAELTDEDTQEPESDNWSDELEYLLRQDLNSMEIYAAMSGGY
jgi:hypothetical protein